MRPSAKKVPDNYAWKQNQAQSLLPKQINKTLGTLQNTDILINSSLDFLEEVNNKAF